MRTILFAAALMAGSAAVAQTTDATTTTDAEMQADTTTTDTTATTTTNTTATTQTTTPMPQTTTTTSAGTGMTVAPGNSNPEEDARGIAVVSDPATAPAGANQPVSLPPGAQVVANANQGAVFSTQSSTQEYPACSKTVTDNCVQAYEVGRRKRR